MAKYVPSSIEKKWQKAWRDAGVYRVNLADTKKSSSTKASDGKKYYLLVELPYPSGDLHMGHWFTFAVTDILGRMKKMQGYNVFFPVGFDAFGLPAENAAMKRGVNPREWTYSNIKTMKEQFVTMGGMHDFEHGVITCDSDYYRWNQWIFLKMLEKGLAYRGKTLSNWCPSCQTVLANENVEAGKCWRCSSEVVQKEVEQWFLKITDYAERLLWPETMGPVSSFLPASARADSYPKTDYVSNALRAVGNPSAATTRGSKARDTRDTLEIDWPQAVREGQNNWIGKSEGIELDFQIDSKVKRFILLHGKGGGPQSDFLPWLREKLERAGYEVLVPQLPNPSEPNDIEQAEFVRKNYQLDEQTFIVGHSFGGVVALRLLEGDKKVKGAVLVATPISGRYLDKKARPSVSAALARGFNYGAIAKNAGIIKVISDTSDDVVPVEDGRKLADALGATLVEGQAHKAHFNSGEEPIVWQNLRLSIRVFTKFPETIFGVTFMVVAPEHWLVEQILKYTEPCDSDESKVQNDNVKQVKDYVEQSKKKSELERASLDRAKSGVFTGVSCVNPVNGQKVPIWVADYVIASYGTGAVMGVPGSDIRDFDFAKQYDLPIVKVVARTRGDLSEIKTNEDLLEDGFIVNSGEFDGLAAQHPAKEKFMQYLIEKGWGSLKVNYHLHDWSISRQRYWGTPIPIIFCANCAKRVISEKREVISINGTLCAIIPVPEKDLPVELPEIADYAPKGKPPLATADDWVNVKCPNCGGKAKREVDTMDTFVDSAWYFLRYVDPKNKKEIFDKKKVAAWMPVELYVGGAEHTLGHTLYSRFFVKFLHDIGQVPFDEYAQKRVHHGVILGPDGARMSKSKGNVVNPDEQVSQFGADAVRMYLAFMGPYDLVAPWNPNGLRGVYHFLQRVWEISSLFTVHGSWTENKEKTPELSSEDLLWMHKTIKKVTQEVDAIKYNTAVAALMEWLNYLSRRVHSLSLIVNGESQKTKNPINHAPLTITEYKTLLLLLAPFAPHMTEELYQQFFVNSKFEKRNSKLNKEDSIHSQLWPSFDERYIKTESVTIVVQVNGKVRDRLLVEANSDQKTVEKLALSTERVQKFLGKKTPQKIIYVPGKLVNLVV